MKRFLALFGILVLCFALVACSNAPADAGADPGAGSGEEDITPSPPSVVTIRSDEQRTVYTCRFSDGVYNFTDLAREFDTPESAQAAAAEYPDNETVEVEGVILRAVIVEPALQDMAPQQVLEYWQDRIATDAAFAGYTATLDAAIN